MSRLQLYTVFVVFAAFLSFRFIRGLWNKIRGQKPMDTHWELDALGGVASEINLVEEDLLLKFPAYHQPTG
jgi:hypothetical protein